mmetsp:Transcript_18707/g.36611  ORF Transcript_18707/g.36611 Transcript_18707/m.36611 type:complete len:86 (+) Transcript_18707:375-632(+)
MEEEEDIGRVGEQEDDDGGLGRLIDTPSNLPGLPDLSDPFVLPDPSDAGDEIAAVVFSFFTTSHFSCSSISFTFIVFTHHHPHQH